AATLERPRNGVGWQRGAARAVPGPRPMEACGKDMLITTGRKGTVVRGACISRRQSRYRRARGRNGPPEEGFNVASHAVIFRSAKPSLHRFHQLGARARSLRDADFPDRGD